MRDLSDIYSAAKAEIHNQQTNTSVNSLGNDFLKNEIKQEYDSYKKASTSHQKQFYGTSTNRLKVVIPVAVIVCVIAVFILLMNINKNSNITDAPSSSITESVSDSPEIEFGQSDTTDELDEQPSEPVSDSIESSSADITVESNDTDETEISTVESSDSSDLEVNEEFVAESFHGYSVGDFVKYSGTVHYTSSYSNELRGACKGGLAIISGINPDGIHPFHLVTADEQCTVYGWVDEYFISEP